MSTSRTEKDFLGELEIPRDSYWGIHTQRAISNFRLGSQKVHLSLIRALAQVKKACCQANAETGHLSLEKTETIERACDEVIAGKLSDHFPIDALQGGAGTSTNMNINEVVANRAIELLGGVKGDYSLVHPLEDVNMSQSTNDVYPTAVKVALRFEIDRLVEAMEVLRVAFDEKAVEFAAQGYEPDQGGPKPHGYPGKQQREDYDKDRFMPHSAFIGQHACHIAAGKKGGR